MGLRGWGAGWPYGLTFPDTKLPKQTVSGEAPGQGATGYCGCRHRRGTGRRAGGSNGLRKGGRKAEVSREGRRGEEGLARAKRKAREGCVMGRQEGEESREVKGGRKEGTGEGEGIKEREGADTEHRGHSLV